jgi:hypothetical protein
MNKRDFVAALEAGGEKRDKVIDDLAYHVAEQITQTCCMDTIAAWLVSGVPNPYGQACLEDLMEEAETTCFITT